MLSRRNASVKWPSAISIIWPGIYRARLRSAAVWRARASRGEKLRKARGAGQGENGRRKCRRGESAARYALVARGMAI